MIRTALMLSAAMMLAGCDLADRLEGKSPGKDWYMHRQAVLLDTTILPDIVVTAPDVIPVVVEPAPTVETPVCLPQFMVRRCGPDGEWLTW